MAAKSCAVLIVIMMALVPVQAGGQDSGAGAAEAMRYLRSRQNPDGGFSEPGAGSDLLTTCWVVLAGAAAGDKPLDWTAGGANPGRFMESAVGSTSSLADLELVAVALSAAGGDPENVAGRDLTALIGASTSSDGRIGSGIQEHSWGIIALAAAGKTVPENNVEWLVGQQRADGGWGASDAALNTDTAIAVEALVAAEEEVLEKAGAALRLLRQRMNPDGGFTGTGRGSDVQATSSVMRAIAAGGSDPASESWSFEGSNPEGYVGSMQAGDGHFMFASGVESQPALTTAMAVTAIAGRHFPLVTGLRNPARDLEGAEEEAGKAGAGIAEVEYTLQGNGVRTHAVTGLKSGAVARSSEAAGFWVFLGACAAYLAVLLIASILAGSLSKRREGPLCR